MMTFLAQELIRKKRDGHQLTSQEIAYIVTGITSGELTDAQLGAFSMATFLRGMTTRERLDLTREMTYSGTVLEWQDLQLNGPVLDKHSTGGVGDKVSLMLAPIVAACGGYVPMVSGRGLGHTGGTLDKLDSIPGYNSQPDQQLFQQVVQSVGCAIIGQTTELAPADQRFYATRDVTGTVESIDLITASILSKKMASNLDVLVMDVKTGKGAFAADLSMARALAQSISEVATSAGIATRCLITDMNQVLGHSVGNAVEVQECVDFLRTNHSIPTDMRLRQLTLELAAWMLRLGQLYPDLDQARAAAQQALDSGAAAEVFSRMITALGGPVDFIDRSAHYLPQAASQHDIIAPRSGYVGEMAVRDIGITMVSLKAGRHKASDTIDPSVGLSRVVQRGDYIEQGQPLARLHYTDHDTLAIAQDSIINAIKLTEQQPEVMPLIIDRVGGNTQQQQEHT